MSKDKGSLFQQNFTTSILILNYNTDILIKKLQLNVVVLLYANMPSFIYVKSNFYQ